VRAKYDAAARTPLTKTVQIAAWLDRTVPIQTAEDLVKFVSAVLHNEPQGLFHRILIHELKTAPDFKRDIAEVARDALKYPTQTIVCFLDETNTTTTIRCLIKEVFIDRCLDGVPLPDNIFWVVRRVHALASQRLEWDGFHCFRLWSVGILVQGAVNPLIIDPITKQPVFLVHPIPLSIDEAVLDYQYLTADQERDFMNYLHAERTRELQYLGLLKCGILHAQQFVRALNMERSAIMS